MQNYQPAKDLLKDRIILVTGAGSGIGKAAALCFAQHGATVILLGRTVKKLEAVYDEIEALGGPKPAIIPLNLESATPNEYLEIATSINNEFGHLDGLLNNAGILGQKTPIAGYKVETWKQVLQVNLTAPFMLSQALLPMLDKSKDSSIVFTSSAVGRKGRAFWGAYAVSKFGIEGLMQTLADELDGISPTRVNCINPGPTRTAMREKAYPAENMDNNPKPEDIMNAYLYLLGPDSKGVSGQSLDAQSE